MYICWLVVTGAWLDYDFPFSWEESSQLTFIFFRGVETTNLHIYIYIYVCVCTLYNDIVHTTSNIYMNIHAKETTCIDR